MSTSCFEKFREYLRFKGIKEEDFLAFIATKPTYVQLEAWVKAYPGAKLTKADIYKHNQAIMGYIHGDDTRKSILESAGLADDGSCNPGAVDLNNLDDWQILWASEIQ